MIDLSRLDKFKVVAVDVETTGTHWYRDKMFAFAIAGWDGKGMQSAYFDTREKPQALEALHIGLARAQVVVNHNAKFDAHFLREAGVSFPQDKIQCTQVRAALINEHEPSFSLDSLCKKYVGEGKVDIWQELADMFGGKATKDVQIRNLHRAPSKLAAKYATPDPELAIKLWLWQEKEIEKQELQQVWDLERRITPMLIDIEKNGVRVDEERATRELKAMDSRIGKAQAQLNHLAGKAVNANSSPQMRALFGAEKRDDGKWYTSAGFELEKTEGGEASIGKDSLMVMRDQGDRRAAAVLALRQLTKAKQFLKDHILGHAVKGRVHPNYNQTKSESGLGTGTGRFSIDDPALQQIPARDVEVAAIVRSCFLPEEKCDWVSADWEQFEFRWFAHYTKDPNILKTYEEDPDADYHAVVSEITGIPRNPRFAGDANAKQINLGLVFGMGRGELAYQMGLDYKTITDERGREWKRAGDKAEKVFATYHSAIPGVEQLLNKAASIARSRGYVRTMAGRHIRFPGGKFTHKAGGLTFQGTSADCMKVKMLELWDICKEKGWDYLLSVHDEHNTSVPKKQIMKGKPVIKTVLEDFSSERAPIKCRVPIRSSVKSGANWWEACKKE